MIITVVGLGVVGGSFVKALKGQGHEVYGVDVDEETLARAKADGCIKEGFVDGREIIKRSDMTIICLYPSLVLDYIKEHEFKKGSIITDAVGVKTHFLNEAMNLLKDKDVEFVSGHPMAGRENKGYLYASKEDFFENIQDDYKISYIIPNAQKNEMEPILIELKKDKKSMELDPHDGEEFGYVIQGKVTLVHGEEEYEVKKGETFYLKGNLPHYLMNKNDTLAKVIWVSTPPIF